MRLKRTIFKGCLVALLLPAGLAARQQPETRFTLNAKGARGAVRFNHTAHETAAPDPASPHRADARATCAGCHHARTDDGAPQLRKCAACHLAAGHERNPKNRALDEVDAERAFHEKCISCHRSAEKGPTACGDCHRPDGSR